MPRKAIIIGAGPAGLTAAYELLKRTDIIPIILEKSDIIGGISRTIDYKGNRMDMGPHRFFSKSDRVMDWWLNIMPLAEDTKAQTTISYQNKSRQIKADNPAAGSSGSSKVMLVIQRLTRIYFLRNFFSYPIQLSIDTLRTLGLVRTIKILFSFLWIRLFPRKPEKSLEDFIINKFGKQLYLLFFKDYTEKVWGIAPSQISAEWGAQRIKGVSLSKAIAQALKSLRHKRKTDLSQKNTETSLIEQFLYPKYGPGSLWEEVARQIQEMGGKIFMNQDVQRIHFEEGKITCVNTINSQTGQTGAWEGDYFFSTMPVKELISGMGGDVPAEVQEIAAGLQYRDFINVGILLKQLSDKQGKKLELKDNWIYIQERDVKVGRLMIYNNWGGGMIKDPNTTWIGMEYFCNKTDQFWANSDETIEKFAIEELIKMDLGRAEDVLDVTVRRMEKTYPAYFGTYDQFDKIRDYTDQFANLFLVGRNGMHKYNNADHSMLTAMVAVDNIEAGIATKSNLWSINTEQEYHEEKNMAPEEPAKLTPTPIKRPAPETFGGYILGNRFNRTLLYLAGALLIIQFVIFKLLYPYAGFINGDSYVYLQSAYYNYDINTYPIGYSKFLRLFSIFTKSDTALVAFQYLVIQASGLWLMFSLFYISKVGRVAKLTMFALLVINPVFLYISNYVSSDSIFLSLSFCWFTLLIWILMAPTIRLIFLQAIVLYIAFVVRYNALYYPLIAILAILLSRQSFKMKLVGVATSILFIACFVWYTSNQYYQLTGIREFSPFSGWQMANNAMYAYRYVPDDQVKNVPEKFKELDHLVRNYYDTSRDLRTHPYEMLMASTMYMWDPRSPLQHFMRSKYPIDTAVTGSSKNIRLKHWASLGPLYSAYGSYLIRRYPMTFFRFYLLPNALKYYVPPGEFLDNYNMGRDTVMKIAQNWFQYKTNKVKTAFKDFSVNSLQFMPILAGILNVTFLFGFIAFLMLKQLRRNPILYSTVIVIFALWLINFGFSVFASAITLRYQLFAITTTGFFALILVDSIYKLATNKDTCVQEIARP